MVEKFYREAPEDLTTLFQFRGATIEISMDRINDYYGMMDNIIVWERGIRFAELTPEEIKSMRQYPNLANEGDDVLASELDVPSVIWLTLLRDNIMPRWKASWFTPDVKTFIHYLRNGVYINVGELILSELQRMIGSMETYRQHSIYFPSLITNLLERYGVKQKKKILLLKPFKPYSEELELMIWGSLGGMKTLCTEVVEKIKEIKVA